jgi:hypothetical protein
MRMDGVSGSRAAAVLKALAGEQQAAKSLRLDIDLLAA